MREAVIQIICAGLGTLGFALFFQVRRQHLITASLGGALSWLCYLAVREICASVFLSSLVASAVICLWSEAMARIRKAPANVFLIPGIVRPQAPDPAGDHCRRHRHRLRDRPPDSEHSAPPSEESGGQAQDQPAGEKLTIKNNPGLGMEKRKTLGTIGYTGK